MARIDNLTNFLTDVANAIRGKKGTTGEIPASSFDTEIASITTSTTEDLSAELTEQTNLLTQQGTTIDEILESLQDKVAGGEISLQEKTVTPTTSEQEVTADSNYDGLSKVTVNAMPTTTQATPSISVSSSGLITASSTQSAGYVSAGTKSTTKQLTTKGATTWTPKTSNQTIASGTYLTGTQTIKGDSNLVASNIKSGVSIFGVTGTLEESVTEDLTSEFNDYESALSTQEATIDDIMTALQGKGVGGEITPTGEITITENGDYDVTEYATAKVNVVADTSELEDAFIQKTISGNYSNDRITKVGYGSFYEDTALTGFDAPNVTKVVDYAFRGCSNLVSVNMPLITSAGVSAFYQIAVENIYFPELTTMGTYTFGGSSKNKTINLPKLKIVQSNGFRQNTGCTKIDLGACTNIYATGFYNMSGLVDLIIRTSSVCTLANINAFSGCSSLESIWVPDDLVDSYKTATNWSTYADKFKPLSELEV